MSDTKIQGGYFLNPDGKSAHDANGNPVPLLEESAALVWSTPNPAPIVISAALVAPVEDEAPPVVVEDKPVEKKIKKAK